MKVIAKILRGSGALALVIGIFLILGVFGSFETFRISFLSFIGYMALGTVLIVYGYFTLNYINKEV